MDGKKVDVVIESVGASTFNKALDQLKRGGTLVAFGAEMMGKIVMKQQSNSP